MPVVRRRKMALLGVWVACERGAPSAHPAAASPPTLADFGQLPTERTMPGTTHPVRWPTQHWCAHDGCEEPHSLHSSRGDGLPSGLGEPNKRGPTQQYPAVGASQGWGEDGGVPERGATTDGEERGPSRVRARTARTGGRRKTRTDGRTEPEGEGGEWRGACGRRGGTGGRGPVWGPG